MERAQQDGTLGAPVQQLKAIIARENRIKDPFRVKKAVTFMINLNQSDSEDEDEDNEEGGAANQGNAASVGAPNGSQEKQGEQGKSAADGVMKKKASGGKGQQIIVLNTNDEQEIPVRKSKKPQLSKEQRNS